MAGKLERVVARLGLSSTIKALISGEFGWDVDTKTFRVGDDSLEPTKIPTNKSVGTVEYSNALTVKYGRVDMHSGGKVDGVDISTMNQSPGIPVRMGDGVFRNAMLEGDNEYIVVSNLVTGEATEDDAEPPAEGPIKIALSLAALNRLNGGVQFTWGPDFPVSTDEMPVKAGHMHLLEPDLVLYILGNTSEENLFWFDISSASGGGGSGVRVWWTNQRPETAQVGDEWYDTEEGRLYKLLTDNADNIFWVELG